MSFNPAIALGQYVERLCVTPITPSNSNPNSNPFHLPNQPPISFSEFCERLGHYMACSPQCYVVASVYVSRFNQTHPHLFTPNSAHKIVLTCLLVAVKFSDDCTYPTAHYARCGGVSADELNVLESKLLNAMKFAAFVCEQEYDNALVLLSELFVMNSMIGAKKPVHHAHIHHHTTSHNHHNSNDVMTDVHNTNPIAVDTPMQAC